MSYASGILTPWYPTIYRHMTLYDVIWRYTVGYASLWRVHTHNAIIDFSYLGIFFDVWICQHTQHMRTACYAVFKSNKNTVQTRLCIYLSYDAIYLSQPDISLIASSMLSASVASNNSSSSDGHGSGSLSSSCCSELRVGCATSLRAASWCAPRNPAVFVYI